MSQRVQEVVIRGSVESWILAGFRVAPSRLSGEIGHIHLSDGIIISILPLCKAHPDGGIESLVLGGLRERVSCDSGLSFESAALTSKVVRPEHPNGIYGIDHVVAAAASGSGCTQVAKEIEEVTGFTVRLTQEQRNNRISMKQVFFKIGDSCSLEIINSPDQGVDKVMRGNHRVAWITLTTSDRPDSGV